MTRALAVAVFASNWLSWRGIPAIEDATSFAVARSMLCGVTAIVIVVALVVHSPPRWLWFSALAAAVTQIVESLIPPPGATSEWEYVGAIFAMACAALVFVAAIGIFVVSFDRAHDPVA